MRITPRVIKADIGSIGGHVRPSRCLLDSLRKHGAAEGAEVLIDSYISFTGDDIAMLKTHTRGCAEEFVHKFVQMRK